MRARWTLVGRGRYDLADDLLCNHRLRLGGPGRIRIGGGCNAWANAEANVLLTFSPGALIEIGNNVRLNGAGLQAASAITVGDDCILGSCTIVDTDHHAVGVDRRRPGASAATAPIRIGRNVWIAGMAAVLKGVTIGDDSVVAFGAVVAGDVPAGVVVAGNPARVVRNLYQEPGPEGDHDRR
ncbi:MAG: acyltransferase [Candidatus Dormibacteria bacterium]